MSDTTTETQGAHESHEASANPDTSAAQNTPAEPAPSEAADVAPPLVSLIATIRSAVARGASPEVRTAGAAACRSILTVLEAKPGDPLAAAPTPAAPAKSPTSPIASLLSQPGFLSKLAAMSREQILDLLKQVTGAMPARPHTPTTAAPRFHLIQIPQVRRPGGT